MIQYSSSLEKIGVEQLVGFFDGWPNPPTPEMLLRLLRGSSEVILAFDRETAAVVGFITAISDGVLSAYIPLLEVRPQWRGQGIGQELTRRMLARLKGLYMIDLVCDPELQPFYARLGMRPANAMVVRNYHHLARS